MPLEADNDNYDRVNDDDECEENMNKHDDGKGDDNEDGDIVVQHTHVFHQTLLLWYRERCSAAPTNLDALAS